MPHLNNEQMKIAIGILAGQLLKDMKGAIQQNAARLMVTFNNTTIRPKPSEHARCVLQFDVPVKLLYEIEKQLISHEQ